MSTNINIGGFVMNDLIMNTGFFDSSVFQARNYPPYGDLDPHSVDVWHHSDLF
ncbi:hypothetical protein [Wolbachia endosymbiont of Pentalonia nigronervosa]|jgi:hypothetical protein|uniref:hypothetical protein n=1 Tax=Wolbachia endosymbiont of Pentalonia nigronervosa TaxID=1301914 RepID=UPI00165FB7A9|nr:hypothetical protein [Wolbachia endosymbiont of Pentalonia nigronervosa]